MKKVKGKEMQEKLKVYRKRADECSRPDNEQTKKIVFFLVCLFFGVFGFWLNYRK